jgi:hydrogenase expression/formation protein HypE
VANEGVCCALVAPEIEAAALEIMRRHAIGSRAVCVGTVHQTHPGKVIMQSSVGGSRIVTPLLGEQLPRIC